MSLVVDASVAAKWLLEEEHSEPARRLLRQRDTMIAPDLIWAEIATIIWKHLRRGELVAAAIGPIWQDLNDVPLLIFPMQALRDDVLDIAQALDHVPYDCFYLALAEHKNAVLITADRRLHAKVERSSFAGLTLWIEDVP